MFNNLPPMNNRTLGATPLKLSALLACFTLAFVVTSNGEETAKEPKAPSKAALKKYDADQDGKLNDEEKARAKAEAKEKREAKKQETLKKYDANANGKLDEEEKGKMKAEHTAEKEARQAEKAARKAEKTAGETGK